MGRVGIILLIACSLAVQAKAQDKNKVVFNGQLSLFGNYSPDVQNEFLFGGRYIPELSYAIPFDSTGVKKIDFFASANISGSANFHSLDSINSDGSIDPYRIWARYSGNQFEVRVGLQKIDFGVATVLRPLQWFNQVDPRDPLAITNGVYGALGRYYFLNNANIWFWTLYGNEKTKGYEVLETSRHTPEIGGRFQHPIPRGEIGLSYHHRQASSENQELLPQYDKIPENRYGLDMKFDVVVGLWLEASHTHKAKDMGFLTNQTLINIGADYTFGIGSGLNVVAEHLVGTSDQESFHLENPSNSTAMTLAYPIGLFDNLSAVSTYSWESNNASIFLNYQHQFPKFLGYIMAFYNPDTRAGLIESEPEYSLTGPGIRLMLVYNH